MLGISRWFVFKIVAVLLCAVGASSLLLLHFMPAPPTTILTATSQVGGGYEFLGRRYQEILGRDGVYLELAHTGGSSENVKLLGDLKSRVMIGFAQGGISNSQRAPNVMSLGRVNYQPFWLFYRGREKLISMQQLVAQHIAVGAEGSGTQIAAVQILGLSGVNPKNSTFSPLGGAAAVKALQEGTVDSAFLAYSANAPIIQSLMRDPNLQVMSFSRTEALTRIFPHLVELKLPEGVIDFAANIPSSDVNLIGTTNAVLVRKDLHPHIVHLLVKALSEEHRKPGLFERAGEFPMAIDPEFEVSEIAASFYKSGPSFLHGLLPFWLVTHVQRLLAVSIAVAAILFPIFSYAPKMYTWFVRERLRALYRRLRAIEADLQNDAGAANLGALETELESVDRGATILGVPMRHSELFFSLKVHIDLMRARLASRRAEMLRQGAKAA